MRIMPTNTFLLKCNIGHTAVCDVCSMGKPLNQLFGESIHVQNVWTNVSVFLHEYNCIYPIQLKKWYAGYYGRNKYNRNPNKKLHNFTWKNTSFLKLNIRNNTPTLIRFKSHQCQRNQIEKHIYFMKDRLAQFNNKWRTLRGLLEYTYKTT